MGYTTDFTGEFILDRPMTKEHADYLNAFSSTRRMWRDADKAETLPDPKRLAVGLPIGEQGGYFVGNENDYGQERDSSILNYNEPPKGQPDLWCQWVVNDQRTSISWDYGEKFYAYVEWIKYIIDNFLKLWGYELNGVVTWSGEESDDLGVIEITDNEVIVKQGSIVYE